MTTTLIDTRKPIIDQIHASWNKFRLTKEAAVFLYGELYHEFNIPLAEDFTQLSAPWTSKQTVLERNAVHANKLIRLYIALNIDVSERMHIWKFFEISGGIVGKIKEQVKYLKRIQKALKLEQQLGLATTDATNLFLTQDVSIYEVEAYLKVKVKKAKAEEKKRRRSALTQHPIHLK